jgi:hypothetical protein
MRRISLNFLAQLVYGDAKIVRLIAMVRSPHGLKETAMCERLPLISDELPEQVKLLWREMHFVSANGHPAGLEVNAQV